MLGLEGKYETLYTWECPISLKTMRAISGSRLQHDNRKIVKGSYTYYFISLHSCIDTFLPYLAFKIPNNSNVLSTLELNYPNKRFTSAFGHIPLYLTDTLEIRYTYSKNITDYNCITQIQLFFITHRNKKKVYLLDLMLYADDYIDNSYILQYNRLIRKDGVLQQDMSVRNTLKGVLVSHSQDNHSLCLVDEDKRLSYWATLSVRDRLTPFTTSNMFIELLQFYGEATSSLAEYESKQYLSKERGYIVYKITEDKNIVLLLNLNSHLLILYDKNRLDVKARVLTFSSQDFVQGLHNNFIIFTSGSDNGESKKICVGSKTQAYLFTILKDKFAFEYLSNIKGLTPISYSECKYYTDEEVKQLVLKISKQNIRG